MLTFSVRICPVLNQNLNTLNRYIFSTTHAIINIVAASRLSVVPARLPIAWPPAYHIELAH